MDKNDILDYVTETPGNTNRAVLKSMLNSVEGSSSLPEVTEDDNGKVLTVIEGVWDKAEGGGGGNPLEVTITSTEEGSNIKLTFDKTWNEVNNAFPNVYAISNIEDTETKCSVLSVASVGSIYAVVIQNGTETGMFTALTADGYPTYQLPG